MVNDSRDSVDTTKLTEAMSTHTRPIQSQEGQNSSMKMLSRNKVPLLSRKLFAIDSCWERKFSFVCYCCFSNGVTLGISTIHRGRAEAEE